MEGKVWLEDGWRVCVWRGRECGWEMGGECVYGGRGCGRVESGWVEGVCRAHTMFISINVHMLISELERTEC